MTDAVFVDTNVLVYVEDGTEPDKQARALPGWRPFGHRGQAGSRCRY
jgi:predicted nucleic acid-binding protein